MIQKTADITDPSQMPLSERGFSLISAIFLLVVIAALGTFAVTLSTTQQQSAALDALGSRAYQAARAGIEWGAIQITHSGTLVYDIGVASACQSNTPLVAASQPPALPVTTQLSVFSVSLACSATSHVDNIDGVTPTRVYQLTSTASGIEGASPGSPDYVERQIRVTIAQ